ncbi:hypothetical protein YIM730264_01130 [Thermus hydrothermalis]
MEAKHVLAALVLGGGAAAVWALRQQRRGDSAPQPAPATAPQPTAPQPVFIPQPPAVISVDLEDWRRKLIEDLRQDLQAAIPKPQPEPAPAPAPSTAPQPITPPAPLTEDWRKQLLEELRALIPKPQPAPEPAPAPSTAPQPSQPVASQPEPTSTSTLDQAIAATAPSCADELPRIREERARIWEEAAAVATGYSPGALYFDEATNTVRHVSDGRIVLNLPYWGLTRYIRGEVEKIWGCVNGECKTHYDLMSQYEPYRQRYLDTLRRERLCR